MTFLPSAAFQDCRRFANLHDTETSSEVAENFCGRS